MYFFLKSIVNINFIINFAAKYLYEHIEQIQNQSYLI